MNQKTAVYSQITFGIMRICPGMAILIYMHCEMWTVELIFCEAMSNQGKHHLPKMWLACSRAAFFIFSSLMFTLKCWNRLNKTDYEYDGEGEKMI